MRDNSGQGDASTNTGDPTLKDNEGRGGTGNRPGDQIDGASFDIGQDKGEKLSPSDRGRGETAAGEGEAPVDLDD